MNDIQLSKFLGLFSLVLGTFELVASRRISNALGLRNSGLVRLFGAREIGAGLMVLNKPDTAMPVWSRVAGDAIDMAVLANRLGSSNRQRHGAAWAMLFVLGTTVLDVAVASSLARRDTQGLQTARRTRVQHSAG